MNDETRMVEKLVGELEPRLIKEAQREMDVLGFFSEGTKQSMAKVVWAKEHLNERTFK